MLGGRRGEREHWLGVSKHDAAAADGFRLHSNKSCFLKHSQARKMVMAWMEMMMKMECTRKTFASSEGGCNEKDIGG